MSEPPASSEPEPSIDSLHVEGVELSLDELGRAYAKAVGLVPDEPVAVSTAEPEPIDDDAACELSPLSILEAILFVGTPEESEPLTSRKIASWIRDVSPEEITKLTKELQATYEKEGSAIRLERDHNKLRFVLASEYDPVRENFYGEVRKARLSQQAIDVLAIVAYNQPAQKDRVTELRGKECGAILNQLVKRNLLSAESPEPKSRVKIYRTTDRFLDLYGLDSLDDLPQSEDVLIPD